MSFQTERAHWVPNKWMKVNLCWSALFGNFKAPGTKKYMQISKGTKVTYKITAIITVLHFSKGAMKTKRGWNGAFKILKERNLQPKNLYLHKWPFKCEGKISENIYFQVFFGHLYFLFCQSSVYASVLAHFFTFFYKVPCVF